MAANALGGSQGGKLDKSFAFHAVVLEESRYDLKLYLQDPEIVIKAWREIIEKE